MVMGGVLLGHTVLGSQGGSWGLLSVGWQRLPKLLQPALARPARATDMAFHET